jgi:S1-C subfamily serine protease
VSPIAESWLYATVRIENQWGGIGTGFLVARSIDESHAKVFMVTNKHVLHQDARQRETASGLRVHLNIEEPDGGVRRAHADVPMRATDGAPTSREHDDPDTDVMAVDVTPLIAQRPDIKRKWATYDLFADREKLQQHGVGICEEVLVIGYPLGLRHATSNLPLVRQGIVSTRIGEPFSDDVSTASGGTRERMVRGFLVDGAVIPGSSGSPVVLKPVPARFTEDGIQLACPPPLLLGIIAETRYPPVNAGAVEIPSFAGLGLAFDAETFRETIELFFE